MASTKKLTAAQAVQDLQTKKHMVPQQTAASMVKKFKTVKNKLLKAAKEGTPTPAGLPEFPLCLTYNKKAITKLLKKTDCMGLRIYPAINAENNFTLVLVAVNEKGENMLEKETAPAPAKKTSGKIVAKSASTAPESPTGTLDEGQSSPPYPVPDGGL